MFELVRDKQILQCSSSTSEHVELVEFYLI